MIECLVVGAGGFVGAVLRYLVGLLDMNPESGFPIKTFIINIAGAFLIGVVAALASREALNPRTVLSEGGNLRGFYHVLFLRTGKPQSDDERRFRRSTHVHGGEPGIGNSGGVHRPAHVWRLRVKNRKKSENNIPSFMGMWYNDNNL